MWKRFTHPHKVYEIESQKQMHERPEVQSQEYSIAGAATLVSASGVGLRLGQPQLRGERRLDWQRGKTKIKVALVAGNTVEQMDGFGGRVTAKRVEFAPRTMWRRQGNGTDEEPRLPRNRSAPTSD